MKKSIANITWNLLVISAMLAGQACNSEGGSSISAAEPQEEQDSSQASFSLSGAYEGDRDGVATMEFFEYPAGYMVSITLTDKVDEAEQSYQLKLQAQSADEGLALQPGTYPIVERLDVERGYAGGFYVEYTHIFENRGGPYANVAMKYAINSSMAPSTGGELIIESVEDGYITGTFELDLYEDVSLNNAPRGEGRRIYLNQGRFKVAIPSGE